MVKLGYMQIQKLGLQIMYLLKNTIQKCCKKDPSGFLKVKR